MSKARTSPRSAKDRALDEIYSKIPSIPGCTGACADACGPIAMFKGEWERVKRSARREPKLRGIVCPLLSPTGRCTVYSVRPFICRLWGTTPALACPEGCKPERWLTREEAHEIFLEVAALTGPGVAGPIAEVPDLWEAFSLEEREARAVLMERIKEAKQRGS